MGRVVERTWLFRCLKLAGATVREWSPPFKGRGQMTVVVIIIVIVCNEKIRGQFVIRRMTIVEKIPRTSAGQVCRDEEWNSHNGTLWSLRCRSDRWL